MWRYPSGIFQQWPPNKPVEYDGNMVKFNELSTVQADSIGYNQAIPMARDLCCTYEVEWLKGEDLIYRERATSINFDVEEAKTMLKSMVNSRRVDFKSGGVIYGGNTYQTGVIPSDTSSSYEQNYFDLASISMGATLLDSGNTAHTLTSAQVKELCLRVVEFAQAIQASCNTLDADADAIVTYEDMEGVITKINGSSSWPATPYPES